MRGNGAAAGVAATLAAAIVWGTSFSVNDIGLRYIGPGLFAFLRFALAGLVAVGVLGLLGRANLGLLRQRWFWLLCGANALAFLLQYVGQTLTTPARTALFVNTSAFTVALIERIFFHWRLGPARWTAIALGFLGASILIVGGDPRQIAGGRLVGDALAMLAGLVWAVYFVMNDRAVEREEPVHLAAWTFAGTAALLVAAPLLDPWLARPDARGLGVEALPIILYSGVVTTALAFGLWTYGLTRVRASISAVLLMVEILVASLVSVALGRESFGLVELVGAGVLVVAVMIAGVVAKSDAPGDASHGATETTEDTRRRSGPPP